MTLLTIVVISIVVIGALTVLTLHIDREITKRRIKLIKKQRQELFDATRVVITEKRENKISYDVFNGMGERFGTVTVEAPAVSERLKEGDQIKVV